MKHFQIFTLLSLFTLAGCATHEHGHNSDNSHDTGHGHHDAQASAAQSLHDIWVLTNLESEDLPTQSDTPTIQLEFNLTNKRVMGFDGCNNFQGGIADVTDSTLSFGPIMSTRKFCPDMEISDRFNQKLGLVKGYKREALTLRLLDETGVTLMKLKKVD